MIEVDNKKDLDKELNGNKRVLVLFYASWCGYCQRFITAFEQKTASFASGKVMHVLLDDYDNQLWDDYDIGAVPTVILFENGKVCSRLDGGFGRGLNEKRFVVWLQTIEG
jgi:thioredoxin 1